ncbi:MAG: phage terminase large subunit, partial [Campylobacter sp.]|nr:phage terminase large subunit [Campylobacter sp.]
MKISVNEKFHFLYDKNELNKYREFIFYGSRGAGKTYDLVQFFLYKAITEKCRILCLREFSNTNKSSLVSEFKNVIFHNDLEAEFNEKLITSKKEPAIKIMLNEIFFKHNGSQILFAGINDNTVMNLKSISNINLCWIEEAAFLTEYAYNILKPTIRAENSKIFYSFNPQKKEDFIYTCRQEHRLPDDTYMACELGLGSALKPRQRNRERMCK